MSYRTEIWHSSCFYGEQYETVKKRPFICIPKIDTFLIKKLLLMRKKTTYLIKFSKHYHSKWKLFYIIDIIKLK